MTIKTQDDMIHLLQQLATDSERERMLALADACALRAHGDEDMARFQVLRADHNRRMAETYREALKREEALACEPA